MNLSNIIQKNMGDKCRVTFTAAGGFLRPMSQRRCKQDLRGDVSRGSVFFPLFFSLSTLGWHEHHDDDDDDDDDDAEE